MLQETQLLEDEAKRELYLQELLSYPEWILILRRQAAVEYYHQVQFLNLDQKIQQVLVDQMPLSLDRVDELEFFHQLKRLHQKQPVLSLIHI